MTNKQKQKNQRPWLDQFIYACSLLSLGFLLYLGGAFSVYFKIFPFYLDSPFDRAFVGMKAEHSRHKMLSMGRLNDFYFPVDHDKREVTIYQPKACYNGYTVFCSGHSTEIQLIDMQGNVLYRWNRPFYDVWPDPVHLEHPVPEKYIQYRNFHLFPNGDILVLYEAHAETPYGYGLAKLDKDSRVIWKYSEHVHHDLDLGEDGKIYTMTQQFIPSRNLMLTDFLVQLTPEDGRELMRIPMFDAMERSPFTWTQVSSNDIGGDVLHCNKVRYITKHESEVFPFAKEGQLLVSIREIDALVVVDPKTKAVTWFAQNSWILQHDPDILDNGNILIFDNLGRKGEGGEEGRSRIVEYNPKTNKIEWEYHGSAEHPFDSDGRGCQQLLPNENLLIDESHRGRIFEITHDGEIVWEYHSPYRVEQEGKSWIAIICGAKRFTAEELPFLQLSSALSDSEQQHSSTGQ
ncbi:aryl-sulfate sulfotransferase [Candidatus Sumerlaeota bacterium]|nr:aryl-sulfate sulfotransferase [Candidatus Sumerlaeota bacterium]